MKKTLALLLTLGCMSLPAMAAESTWMLDHTDSSVELVSVKKGSVGEVFHFTQLSGTIVGPRAELKIDLASIDSGVDIRNERMREHLFEVSKFATATATITVAPELLAIQAGESRDIQANVELSLHGIEKSIPASLRLIGLNNGLLVVTKQPVLVKASDFALADGIETLRTLAKLPAIATVVPVTLQLHFSRAK